MDRIMGVPREWDRPNFPVLSASPCSCMSLLIGPDGEWCTTEEVSALAWERYYKRALLPRLWRWGSRLLACGSITPVDAHPQP